MRQQPIKLSVRPAPACVCVRSPSLAGMGSQGSPPREAVPDQPPWRKGLSGRDRASIGPVWRSADPCGGLRCSAGLSSRSGCARGVSQVSRPERLGGGGSGDASLSLRPGSPSLRPKSGGWEKGYGKGSGQERTGVGRTIPLGEGRVYPSVCVCARVCCVFWPGAGCTVAGCFCVPASMCLFVPWSQGSILRPQVYMYVPAGVWTLGLDDHCVFVFTTLGHSTFAFPCMVHFCF